MAHCVIRTVLDGDGGRLACIVHTHIAPCPLNGQPASPGALHCDDQPGREAVIGYWVAATDGQRTLVIHRGDIASKHKPHRLRPDVLDCWCEPEVFLGERSPRAR